MLLRSVSKHVKDQNWFAVGLDLAIVVIGVFIGIQVSNWNDDRESFARETELLIELRSELEWSIRMTEQKAYAIGEVASAGTRSLDLMAAKEPCGNSCWLALVDFFHASQWQSIEVQRSTYDELRRAGFPRSREIIDAIEFYLAQNASLTDTWKEPPLYRSMVRRYIPVEAQSYYWVSCFDLTGGVETYVLDCPDGVAVDVSARVVNVIMNNPDIQPLLTEWTGLAESTPRELDKQNKAAELAIAAIDEELEQRQ